MGRRPTSRARTRPIRWRRSSRRPCCAVTRSRSRRPPIASSVPSPTSWRTDIARRIWRPKARSPWAVARWDAWYATVSRSEDAPVERLTVAVVGAAGLAGREILRLLGERDEPPGELRLLGSPRTAGATIEEGDLTVPVRLLGPGMFDGV